MNYKNYILSKIRAIAIFLVILIAVFTGCAQNMAAKKDMELFPEPKLITEISTSEDSKLFNVLVKGNCVLTYMSVKQLSPLAVLLYFPETALDNIKTNILPESEIIGSITASELTEEGHKSRIKIALKKDVLYKVANEGTGLKISFSKPSKVLASPILSSSEPVEKKKEKAVVESKTTTKYKKPACVNHIDFSSEKTGKSTIIIGTTRPVEYEIKKASHQSLQLKLLNTRLPDYRKFPLITTRFESAVDRIIPVQTPAMENTFMLTIELREAVPYFIEQNEDQLLVHFEAPSISPRPLEDDKLPALKEVFSQAIPKEETKTEIAEKAPYGVAAEKYTGEKIALDFYETDIKNVFRILKEVSGKNFAIDKDVAGKVTLSLDKPVPWDQILDLVLKMNQLDKVFEGDIIRVATVESLKKEEKQHNDLLKAKKEKKALEQLFTEYIRVNYADAQEDILPKIEPILSGNRGSASADQRTNTIIITDVAEKIKKAREIINKLDQVTPQVIIEARIVEATTNFSREIGIQWEAESGTHAFEKRFNYSGNMAVDVPLTSSAMSLGFNLTKIIGTTFLLDAKLMAMESQGKGKIISAPKIVTLDNKTATIKQGLRYPYLKLDESGNTTIEFEDIDLVLEVKPHVTPDDRISMNIKIEKKDLGVEYTAGRSFITKSADTELLVNNGDTVVIGGIIKTTKSFTDTGVPGLSKIPFIGWFFKSTNKEATKEELLIFITPKILKLEQRSLQN
ncbi:MAG: type IV pilus secretin PilQ [Deltaproteobacteria bacterium]|nr:type IV pilus secretin PilQ [Deltaproteobacteria bacterium]